MREKRSLLVPMLLFCVVALHLAPCCADLLEVVETQGEAIAQLQAQVGLLSERQCQCQQESLVAFTVYMDNPTVKSVTGKVIPFSYVRTNLGGVFNTTTSTFTAPSQGTYIIYAHLDCTSDYREFRVNVNGAMMAMAHNDADDHSLSTYVILTLQKGDGVNLVHDRPNGALDGGMESMFAGFRLGD